jgi:hypothetical protein
MHTQPVEPKAMNFMLVPAWGLTAMVVMTALLGIARIIDMNWTLAAVILCGPPAFIFMLLADKIDVG